MGTEIIPKKKPFKGLKNDLENMFSEISFSIEGDDIDNTVIPLQNKLTIDYLRKKMQTKTTIKNFVDRLCDLETRYLKLEERIDKLENK